VLRVRREEPREPCETEGKEGKGEEEEKQEGIIIKEMTWEAMEVRVTFSKGEKTKK
jgi:hypothetical protein